MRILHTADWHLGRSLHGQSLIEDQAGLLEQLVAMAKATRPDVVVIAGDLFDRAVPPVEAVELLDETLCRLALDLGLAVVAIAGNHDSPMRLGYGARLLARGRVHMITAPCPSVVPFEDRFGPVELVAIPYAEPAAVRIALTCEAHDHAAALTAQLGRVASGCPRRVAVAHAFVTGGDICDSERPLTVGGTGCVPLAAFTGFAYTALGHLHRPQAHEDGRVRYAGSLMKYSFGEAGQAKGAVLVEIDGVGAVRCEVLPLTPRRDLVVVEGLLDELRRRPPVADYAAVRLLDTRAILDAQSQLRDAFPNLLELTRPFYAPEASATAASTAARERGMEALFADFFAAMTGEPIGEEERAAFADAFADWERQQREAAA